MAAGEEQGAVIIVFLIYKKKKNAPVYSYKTNQILLEGCILLNAEFCQKNPTV